MVLFVVKYLYSCEEMGGGGGVGGEGLPKK